MINKTIDQYKTFWSWIEEGYENKNSNIYLEAKEIYDFFANRYFDKKSLTTDVISEMIQNIESLIPEEKGQIQPIAYYLHKGGLKLK